MVMNAKKFLVLGAVATLSFTAGLASANDFNEGISMVNGQMQNSAVVNLEQKHAPGTKVIKEFQNPIKGMQNPIKNPIKPIGGYVTPTVNNNVSTVLAKFRDSEPNSQNKYKPR